MRMMMAGGTKEVAAEGSQVINNSKARETGLIEA